MGFLYGDNRALDARVNYRHIYDALSLSATGITAGKDQSIDTPVRDKAVRIAQIVWLAVNCT